MKKATTVLLLMMLGCMATAQASITNPGFETGDFTGWTTSVPYGATAKVVTSHASGSTTYYPVFGNYFAELKTDGGGAQNTVQQSFTILSGQTIQGYAAFDWGDYGGWVDPAKVEILSGTSVIATPWAQSGAGHPSYWDGPWEYWSWTSATTQTVTLRYRIANTADSSFDSYALFDASEPQPAGVIPEPASLLVWSALAGLGIVGIRRRRRSA